MDIFYEDKRAGSLDITQYRISREFRRMSTTQLKPALTLREQFIRDVRRLCPEATGVILRIEDNFNDDRVRWSGIPVIAEKMDLLEDNNLPKFRNYF